MLTGYVKERLAQLLAENRPRRASPEEAAIASRPDLRSDDGLPDDEGLVEDDPLAWTRRPAHAPPATGAGVEPRPFLDLLDGQVEPPTRRRFSRTHVGVVAVLLIVGLLGAGWSALRARPVAIASTPTAPGSVAAPATSRVASSSTPAAKPAARILVHVLGAVRQPGVVSVPERARVSDAIKAAGGLTRDAAPGELNLAQVLTDGQQVLIGTARKPTGEVRDGSGGAGTGSAGAGSPDPGGGAQPTVNLNAATQAQLETLPGVGPVTAGKVLAWREEHGRFTRVEELQEIDGIGPKTYAELAPHVRV